MLNNVGRIRLVSELASDPFTTTREAVAADGEPRIARIGKAPVRLDEAGQARFDRECEATVDVEGAFVAPVLDHGVSFSMPWVAHPVMSARPLTAALADAPGPLDPAQVAVIGADVATALEAAHALDPPLLHLALGPDTVWIDGDLHGARVVGYGLSRLCAEAGRALPPMREALDRFAAPEQTRGEEAGPAADVFSLAALLVFLATGELRKAGELDATTLDTLPSSIRAPIARALAADPDARGDAAALREALRAAVDDEGAARDTLGERFGLEGRRDTDPPPLPEGAPAMGLPLENVTREQLLPEARASYATFHPGEGRPSWADSTEDDAFDDDPFAPLEGEGTRVDTSLDVIEHEDGDTKEVALPDAPDAAALAGFDDLPGLPTIVHGHHLPSIAPPGDVPERPPLERTLELPMPPEPSAVGSPRNSVPTLPPSMFRETEPIPEPTPPSPAKAKREPMMVAGWPVTWLVAMGAGAVAVVALVAALTAFLASC